MLESLEQRFLGCGRGLDSDGRVAVDAHNRPLRGRKRGAFQWTRRALTLGEAELLARAVATAGERLADRLHGELPVPEPAEVLATADDDDLHAVATHLLADARAELAERERLVDEELDRRLRTA